MFVDKVKIYVKAGSGGNGGVVKVAINVRETDRIGVNECVYAVAVGYLVGKSHCGLVVYVVAVAAAVFNAPELGYGKSVGAGGGGITGGGAALVCRVVSKHESVVYRKRAIAVNVGHADSAGGEHKGPV